MTINIIGIDCATPDKNVGVALGRLTSSHLEFLDVFVGNRPGSVLDYLAKSYVRGEPTLLALDAPIGWPVALGDFLARHAAGDHIAIEANALFRRRTDTSV